MKRLLRCCSNPIGWVKVLYYTWKHEIIICSAEVYLNNVPVKENSLMRVLSLVECCGKVIIRMFGCTNACCFWHWEKRESPWFVGLSYLEIIPRACDSGVFTFLLAYWRELTKLGLSGRIGKSRVYIEKQDQTFWLCNIKHENIRSMGFYSCSVIWLSVVCVAAVTAFCCDTVLSD